MQMHLDRVKPQFFQRTLESDLVLSEREARRLQTINDLLWTHTTVEVTFIVGIRFDRNRLLAQFVGQNPVLAQFLKLDGS